ncbi:9930_t:CDS:2, partial [Acaulospora colombiana]
DTIITRLLPSLVVTSVTVHSFNSLSTTSADEGEVTMEGVRIEPSEDYQEFIARQVHATLSLFDLSPSKFPFDERRITKIRERRKQLNGTLFIDYMLGQAGIVEPTKVFPPTNPEELKFLITSVFNGEWGLARSANVNEWSQDTATSTRGKDLTAGIKRACVIYYLLAWWEGMPNLRYSDQQRISSQFVELTHAYFLMDTGNTAEATSLLCTPLISPEPILSEKIFQTLALATDVDPNVLILRYARMAKPPLASETVTTLFVSALAKVNFVEAWNHQRTYEEELRKDLLKALHLLSSVPFQPLERDFLHDYALNPMPLGPKTPLEMH